MKLVTGGSGFVGGHIVEHLLDRGDEVRVFDQHPPEVGMDDVEFVKGDIRDKDAVSAAMDGVDVVYHNVALVPVTKAGTRFREVNVNGTEVAVNAAVEADVDRFIHMGSSSVYSLQNLPLTEETPLEPKGPYSESKLRADNVVLEADGIDVTVIRPRTVVDRRRSGIFAILFDWISRGKRVYTVGPGDNQFQMVSGKDLARACTCAAETPAAIGEVYNIGGAEFGTMRNAYEALIDHAKTGSSVTAIPRLPTKAGMWLLDRLDLSPLTTFHYKTIDKDFYFDVSKARSELGWEPQHGNTDCMRRAYDWYVEHEDKEAQDQTVDEGHRKAPDQRALRLLRRLS